MKDTRGDAELTDRERRKREIEHRKLMEGADRFVARWEAENKRPFGAPLIVLAKVEALLDLQDDQRRQDARRRKVKPNSASDRSR